MPPPPSRRAHPGPAAAATSAPTAAATSSACQPHRPAAAAAGTPKAGGKLQVGMIGDLGTIDGHQVTQATVNVTFLGYDRLIDYDDKLTPIPMLAESWDISSDLTQFKLNLRKGVQFHSGREFTSDDVKYNMLRVRDPKVAGIVGALAAESNWFSSIETPDKYTVVLKSDKPRPGAFDFLEYFNMLDKDTTEGPDAKTKIVGTGPFTFVEWVAGRPLHVHPQQELLAGRQTLLRRGLDPGLEGCAGANRPAGSRRRWTWPTARRFATRRGCGMIRSTTTWARSSAASTSACSSTPANRRSTTRRFARR